MKNEYGVTAIKLILTMVLIIAIFGIAIFGINKVWDYTSVKDIKTDLLFVQAKCKIIKDNHIINEDAELLGEAISEYPENDEINSIVSASEGWYKLSQDDLNAMGATNLKAEDGYIVNYDTEEIIYVKGIVEDDKIYYKLSDILDDELEDENEETGNDETGNDETDVELDEIDTDANAEQGETDGEETTEGQTDATEQDTAEGQGDTTEQETIDE